MTGPVRYAKTMAVLRGLAMPQQAHPYAALAHLIGLRDALLPLSVDGTLPAADLPELRRLFAAIEQDGEADPRLFPMCAEVLLGTGMLIDALSRGPYDFGKQLWVRRCVRGVLASIGAAEESVRRAIEADEDRQAQRRA